MNNNYIKSKIMSMTLEQKIGALLTLGFSGTVIKPHIYDYIEKYHCGGLRLSPEHRTFGNYVDPKTGETVVRVERETGYKKGVQPFEPTASQYKMMLDDFQKRARKRPCALPLHFSFDQEGGSSADFFFGGVNLFPKPMGIRATGDKKMAYEVAKASSAQCKAVGFNWVHSPVLDINTDPRNPEIYTRAYSDVAQEVAEYAMESCRGYKEAGMITTGKHFPGRGDSPTDAHFELPVIDVDIETMMERELLPYRLLIEKDLLPSIMIAHSIFPSIDPDNIATVSKKVLTGLLREKLGFEGVIATDSMTMGAIATRYGVANACAMALESGADLVLMKAENELVDKTFNTIRSFVEKGRISIEELDKKVYRVLSLKYDYGLFHESNTVSRVPEEIINDESIKALAKQVAKGSVLLPRMNKNILPIKENEQVLVIEQIVKHYNSYYWHPGMLCESMLKYSTYVDYLETSFTYDEEDQSRILNSIEKYDCLVITNFFVRGKLSNTAFIDALIQSTKKKIVVVTNTPYKELSVPKNAENLVITFASTPENLKVVAGALYGEIVPQGQWPIAYQLD